MAVVQNWRMLGTITFSKTSKNSSRLYCKLIKSLLEYGCYNLEIPFLSISFSLLILFTHILEGDISVYSGSSKIILQLPLFGALIMALKCLFGFNNVIQNSSFKQDRGT